MKLIVCMKIVLDPEAPASMFQVDVEAKRVLPLKGNPPVLNPFDENALDAALRIKDAHPGTSITVLSLGKSLPRPIIRKSLATGADELVVLEDEAFADLESFASASLLASAIKKIGHFDLILCGREAADTDAGQVGSGIAELLAIPGITLAGKIEIVASKLRVERVLPEGYEVLESPLPALVTVSSELGSLRTAALAGIMAAQKKPLQVWKAQDLGFTPTNKKTSLLKLFQPAHEGTCEILKGTTPEEAATNLASKLKESKLV